MQKLTHVCGNDLRKKKKKEKKKKKKKKKSFFRHAHLSLTFYISVGSKRVKYEK
jgi:hypothetical protein